MSQKTQKTAAQTRYAPTEPVSEGPRSFRSAPPLPVLSEALPPTTLTTFQVSRTMGGAMKDNFHTEMPVTQESPVGQPRPSCQEMSGTGDSEMMLEEAMDQSQIMEQL